jgi:hypothetical protein
MRINEPDVVAELQGLYPVYETALVTNDVKKLTELFWNSPLATRFGITENLHGYEEIAAFRQGRGVLNLERKIRRLDIVALGPDHGQINLEFERMVEGRLLHGRQSQLWVRFAQGWRIVSAHVSVMGYP